MLRQACEPEPPKGRNMRTILIALAILVVGPTLALANPSPTWQERCKAAAAGQAVMVDKAEFESAFPVTTPTEVEGFGTFSTCGKKDKEGEYSRAQVTLPDGSVVEFDRNKDVVFEFGGRSWRVNLKGIPSLLPKKVDETKLAQARKARPAHVQPGEMAFLNNMED